MSIDIDELIGPHLDAMEASHRSAVQIELVAMDQDDVTASKVGGRAYWPDGEAYPVDVDGNPLFLLAQVDFAQMPLMHGYPGDGLLQFFIASDDHYGANFSGPFNMQSLSAQKGFRVVYWPAPLRPGDAAPQLAADREHSLPFDPAQPRRMRFSEGSETVSVHDVGFERVFGASSYDLAAAHAEHKGLDEDAVGDALHDRFSSAGHKLGGYPFFTQSDPRSQADAHVLLLQLDSDDDMMWGDSGVANFFIHPDDLARRDFSRVAYNWDCY